MTIRCCVDTIGQFLAVDKSSFALVSILTKEPIIGWQCI
jgi:hypothetical protein